MASTTAAIAASVKRACDGCHRRKIKCVGRDASTCESCTAAGLACTYNAIPKKKGPKGRKARVLAELRSQQQNTFPGAGILQELDNTNAFPRNSRTLGLISPMLLEQCVSFYFASIYPLQPVLQQGHVHEAVVEIDVSAEACRMVLTLCACTMIQTDTEVLFNPLGRPETVRTGRALLEESCRLQSVYDYRQNPTHRTILTSWFSYACYLELGELSAAWCHLREATTQALLLGMHDEATYRLDPEGALQKRALYWLLFVAERTHGIQQRLPITLPASLHAPSPSGTCHIQTRLARMVKLYRCIDGTFIDLWNGVRCQADPSWVHELQMSLHELTPNRIGCTEGQAAEIVVAQHWLRAAIWQLCSSRGLLGGFTNESVLFFSASCIAKDLQLALVGLPHFAVQARGGNLAGKLFDVACCLVDAVARQSSELHADASGSQECIVCLLTLARVLHNRESRFLPLLYDKVKGIVPHTLAVWLLGSLKKVSMPPVDFCAHGWGTLHRSVYADSNREK